MRVAVFACVLIAMAPESLAQAIPRTSEGRPDFHGVWTSRWTTPLERMAPGPLNISEAEGEVQHRAFLARMDAANPLGVRARDLTGPLVIGGQTRSSVIVEPADGLIPYTPEGRARRGRISPNGIEGDEGPERRNGPERCLISGNGQAPFMSQPANNNRQIAQTREHVVIFTESYNQLRIIPLDGSSGAAAAWGGASAGRWDGDTLVVETGGFSERDAFRNASGGAVFPLTPRTRITERFTRTSADEILYRFSIDDPLLYAQAWTGESVLRRSSERLYEFACHEGNYSMAGILGGARRAERLAAKQTP